MKPNHIKYYSKLLLFGEYTVGMGGSALAVPNLKFYGQWMLEPSNQQKEGLVKLLSHIRSQPTLAILLDISGFEAAICEGWYFQSNIPLGYGLGSSGALVAAVMDCFGSKLSFDTRTSAELIGLKNTLANMECAFHGVSSGIDPLVSYLNKGVHIIDKSDLVLLEKPIDLIHFFLIDSKISRSTTPLVGAYNSVYHNDQQFHDVQNQIAYLNQLAIAQLISRDLDQVWQSFNQISALQYESYTNTKSCGQITDFIKPIWEASLTDTTYAIKLCGAGGGGVFLGMALNVDDFLAKHPHLTIHRLG